MTDELASPYWRLEDSGGGGFREMCARFPATVGPVASIVRRAAPVEAVVIAVLQVAAGCATAFGLLATAGLLEGVLTGAVSVGALAAVAGAYALRGACETAVALAHTRMAPAVRRLAEGELFAAALGAELAAFDDPAFYDRLHRARDRGVFHVERAVNTAVDLVGAALAVAAACAGLGVLHPALLPVLALGVLPQAWSVQRAARLAYRHVAATVTLDRRVRMVTDLGTAREPAAEIRACQAEEFLLREYAQVADPLRDAEAQVGAGQVRAQAAGRALAGVAAAATFAALGALLQAGWIALAAAGAAVIAVRAASGALSRLVFAAHELLEQGLYVADYRSFLADAAARRGRSDGTAAHVGHLGPGHTGDRAAPTPRRITLHDVHFRYPGNPVPALRGITLTLEAGQTVALVGENGSGKSTLARILAGLYTPASGRVCWDGADLATLDRRSVADRIMLVAQHPIRWPHTARANVRAGRFDRADPGDAALRAAAALAGADDVVAGLPQGWDTLLSQYFRGGVDLSGGQWQRLAIARGLFRDAPLLIWDEPTAPLDARAEFAVYESLRRLAGGRTVVLITHRLASVRNADRVYLLDHGELAEQGTHDELLARGGRYADLWAHAELLADGAHSSER